MPKLGRTGPNFAKSNIKKKKNLSHPHLKKHSGQHLEHINIMQSIRRFATTARCYSSKLKSGQPIFENRPHRIPSGELTPGITSMEYYQRRQQILQSLPDKSMVVVPGNEVQFATQSVFHPFRQDPNFTYLTGFLEPNSALILHREDAGNTRSIFFVPEEDPKAELWDGERAGTRGAKEIFNADEAYAIGDIATHVRDLIPQVDNVYADLNETSSRFPRFFKSTGQDIFPGSFTDVLLKNASKQRLKSAIQLIEQKRLYKSENEIDCLRAANEISALAYNEAYKTKFAKESNLHAFLDYKFRINGCEEPAYLPVVAGGKHALTIHYTRNDDILRDEELVLVDGGGRFGQYCADISRTWPVNGKFTTPQRDLYQAVLNTQKRSIELCTEKHGVSLDDVHRAAEDYLFEELLNAGMATLTRHQIRKLMPHFIGHDLGLCVHDLKTVSRFEQLKSNRVITIEPGVYVPEDPIFPKHFHNIGIRIEDNIVIGPSSYENLTMDVMKEIEDVENAL